jgi:phage terminase large subunit-like protein
VTRADRNIKWIENACYVPEGRDVGKPVILREWQRKEIRRIYDNPLGTRRAILSFGRKNGKTAISSFILLLHLCGPEAKPNSQLVSAAQSRDQSSLLFGLAAKVVRMSPELAPFVTIRDTKKELLCRELGTIYRALSAEASTAFGLSPALIVHDELGQVKGPRSELYEALETATGAQEAPLSIIISTQAPTEADLLSLLISDAQTGLDPRVVLSLYTADPDADPFAEETIRQANPAFGDFQNAAEVMAMAEDARRMPSRESEFRNLILNQKVEVNNPFISKSVWQSCGGDVVDSFKGLPVYGGLDLSEVNDLTALVLVAPVDGIWHVKPTFWLPGNGLRERARNDRAPYDLWAEQGHLVAIDAASSVEYEYIAALLRDVFDSLDVRKLAFDRWNFRHLKPWLLKAGFTEQEIEQKFEEFGQGFMSMSPALRTTESELLNRKLAHGGHPVLTMCMANAVVQTDPAGGRKLSKSKSRGRIDGAVSLVMAMAVAETYEEAAPLDIMAMIA